MKISEADFIKLHKGELSDPLYLPRCKESEKIQLHSAPSKELIEKLLEKTYPGEPHYIREYKIGNWKSITKTYFSKICKTLSKIQKAEDFSVSYPNTYFREYLEYQYPLWGSFWEWAFSYGILSLLQEPNGCVVIFPTETGPLAHIFSASQFLFHGGDFFIFRKTPTEYFYVDNEQVQKVNITTAWGGSSYLFSVIESAEFNFPSPPAFIIGGAPQSVTNPQIFESIIAGVCPFWDQALLDFSELTCGIKQHVFPDKWRYVSGMCKNCNGTGKITLQTARGKITDICKACGGSGDPPTGMFSEILLHAPTGIEDKPPIPPLGYVKKDFEPIEFLRINYKEMLHEGLRAINLEFLFDSPLNQSGRAKEFDRQELNSFLYNFAELFLNRFVKKTLYFFAKFLFPEIEDLTLHKEILPQIVVPTHFDFIVSDRQEWVKQVKEGKFSPQIIAETEKRYIEKEFENFNYERNFLILCNLLDPLRGYDINEKIDLYNAGSVSAVDFIASIHIQSIIREAIETTYGYSFLNWKYLDQKSYVRKKAEMILSEINPPEEIYGNAKTEIARKSPEFIEWDRTSLDA